jgi:hypothetical protein
MNKLIGGIVLCIIIIVIVSTCGNCGGSSASSSNNSYGEGYNKGYNDAKSEYQKIGYENGFNDAKKEYQDSGYESGYNRAKEEYQLRIDKLAAENEVKTKESYNKGFIEGEVSMRDRITEEIELNAKNKARQGDWSAILFDPKR